MLQSRLVPQEMTVPCLNPHSHYHLYTSCLSFRYDSALLLLSMPLHHSYIALIPAVSVSSLHSQHFLLGLSCRILAVFVDPNTFDCHPEAKMRRGCGRPPLPSPSPCLYRSDAEVTMCVVEMVRAVAQAPGSVNYSLSRGDSHDSHHLKAEFG